MLVGNVSGQPGPGRISQWIGMPLHRRDLVRLFTDGACSGNPGPGGWAFILHHPASGQTTEASGAEPEYHE